MYTKSWMASERSFVAMCLVLGHICLEVLAGNPLADFLCFEVCGVRSSISPAPLGPPRRGAPSPAPGCLGVESLLPGLARPSTLPLVGVALCSYLFVDRCEDLFRYPRRACRVVHAGAPIATHPL